MTWAERVNRNMPFPMDGTAFATDQFLQSLVAYDQSFYKLYDRNLQYFSALHNVEGNDDIERVWPAFIRLAYEFGKVALARYNGKFVVLNIVEEEYTIDYKIKSIKGIVAPRGYGKLNKMTKVTIKGEDVVTMRSNYNAFPFMFYWRDIITNLLSLKDAALTASKASIKKFKRNVQNNSSSVAKVEMASMIDTSTPAITVIANPPSYFDEDIQKTTGNQKTSDVTNSTAPNSITFETNVDSAEGQWENLKNYQEWEYYQNGRRVNTNKKSERNIAKEIDTETVNFDILENDFERYLEIAIKEMNTKFGLSLTLINKGNEFTNEGGEDEQRGLPKARD